MDSNYDVLNLDRHNPVYSKMAIESTAKTLDAISHLASNAAEPADTAQH